MTFFDANQVEDMSMDYDPLAKGKHRVLVLDSELKVTKDGSGRYLEVRFEVIDGASKGRYHWERYNIENQNEMAQNIGRSQLKQLCIATGKTLLNQPTDLCGSALLVEVKHRKDKGSEDVRAFVAKYYLDGTQFDASGNAIPPVQQQSYQPAQQQYHQQQQFSQAPTAQGYQQQPANYPPQQQHAAPAYQAPQPQQSPVNYPPQQQQQPAYQPQPAKKDGVPF